MLLKVLLKVETAIALPFFLLSWMACAIWYAVKAGHSVAAADGEDKEEVLTEMFAKKRENTTEGESK